MQLIPLQMTYIAIASSKSSENALGNNENATEKRFGKLEKNIAENMEKNEKLKMPLLGELSRSSRDSFESESDSKESRDDRLNSTKSGFGVFPP